jgi:hypothetical protein
MQVGNAWTNAFYDNTVSSTPRRLQTLAHKTRRLDLQGAVDMWYWHNMIDLPTHDGIIATCNMSGTGPLAAVPRKVRFDVGNSPQVARLRVAGFGEPGALGFTPLLEKTPTGDAWTAKTVNGLTCDDWQNQANTQMGSTDIYDAYSDVCVASAARKNPALSPRRAFPDPGDSNTNAGCAIEYDPCIDDKTTVYLNTPAVQNAIHVLPGTVPSGKWETCSSVVNYSYDDLLTSIVPVYFDILDSMPGGRWLVYSVSPVLSEVLLLAALSARTCVRVVCGRASDCTLTAIVSGSRASAFMNRPYASLPFV